MISTDYVMTMARYNRWQNGSLIAAAETLPPQTLTEERGAFWGSIQKTLSHILWADRIWMARFERTERPAQSMAEGATAHASLAAYISDRESYDAHILTWADTVESKWLASDLTWFSGAAGLQLSMPAGLAVTHFFNHQTHHRGQAHAMITSAGAKPEDTDLFLMPGAAAT